MSYSTNVILFLEYVIVCVYMIDSAPDGGMRAVRGRTLK